MSVYVLPPVEPDAAAHLRSPDNLRRALSMFEWSKRTATPPPVTAAGGVGGIARWRPSIGLG